MHQQERAVDQTIVVTDACIFITLIESNELRLLESIKQYKFVCTQDVVAEVRRPAQAKALRELIDAGTVEEIVVQDTAELIIFAELRAAKLGPGEAASIAVAQVRGWHFLTDEKGKCRRVAVERLGADRLLTTDDLRALVESGINSV